MAREGGLKRLTTDDALQYVKAVRDAFHDKKEIYDRFLHTMKEYKDKRIDTEGVVAIVKELFEGHSDLLMGFNTFVPNGYEINLPLENQQQQQPQPPKRISELASSFVNKVKDRFGDDYITYKCFLNIMNKLGEGKKTLDEAYHEGAALLQGHADLLHELALFFPSASGAHSISTTT